MRFEPLMQTVALTIAFRPQLYITNKNKKPFLVAVSDFFFQLVVPVLEGWDMFGIYWKGFLILEVKTHLGMCGGEV